MIETYEVIETIRYSFTINGILRCSDRHASYAEEGQTLIYEDGKYTMCYMKQAILPNFTLYIGDVDYELRFQSRKRHMT